MNTTRDNIKAKIKNLVNTAVLELGLAPVDFAVEHPGIMAHGDYATNVAMVLAKQAGTNPKDLAEKITEALRSLSFDKGEDGRGYISEVSVAGAGFINFKLTPQYFNTVLQNIVSENTKYDFANIYSGKKILVEHSSPNLFKPFHIGHVMNNTIGEAITRLARASGADVNVISYPSDVSLGIAKAVYILLQDGLNKLEDFSTDYEKLAYLGECYVRGTKAYDDEEGVQQKVREIVKCLYDHVDGPELQAYELGKQINLEYFKNTVARLGTKFDAYIFESEAGVEGKQIVTDNTPAVFTQSDGATIYEGERDGLHTRVFINSEGFPTYEAKDIGLMSLKFKRYNPDLSIFITDNQQANYFEVVSTAAGKINPIWQNKTVHRIHGRMSFKGQKMSSRLGGAPMAIDLLNAVTDEVVEKAPDLATNGGADQIAISAIKFSILRAKAGSNINFDPDTSLSFEGDSGPYLQYTAVRAGSLLQKAAGLNLLPNINTVSDSHVTTDVEKYLNMFDEVVAQSINEWAPHYVANYLLELAHSFNTWYAGTKIVDIENINAPQQLAIVLAVRKTLMQGLNILGIETPDKM
jgi:arginyl-tRNA synthetase